jgi:transposase InsO family protein
MSINSRKEYLPIMMARYGKAEDRSEKTKVIDELVKALEYHRKHAIRVLRKGKPQATGKVRRKRSSRYSPALPSILLVWRALDYPCAERLHPALLQTAELLEKHGEIHLGSEVRKLLSEISRPTLARMLLKSRSKKRLRMSSPRKKTHLETQVPIGCYGFGEMRPGALEADLVEHNGGSSLGHFAYTLSVVDVATGYSRRRSVLGRGQLGVHRELKRLLMSWPYLIWGIHTDNGSEFLNDHLIKFCQANNLKFTRSRPYKKNDNPHVEQKNFQHVRCLVGYERFDTPEQVAWLNKLYGVYDHYVNLFQPTRKLISKERHGGTVRKRYDTAKTPLQRALDAGVVPQELGEKLKQLHQSLNPLALHRQIESLVAQCPSRSRDKSLAKKTTVTAES